MTSSVNIPHTYTTGVNTVSPLDWNAVFKAMFETIDKDTTTHSPYTPTIYLGEFRINADSGIFEFNLPAVSSIVHPDINDFKAIYSVFNLPTSLYNTHVNPDGTDDLRGVNTYADLLPGERILITSGTGGFV